MYDFDYGETLHTNVVINYAGTTSATATIETSVTMPLAFMGRIDYSLNVTEVTLAPGETILIQVTVTGTRAGGADLHLTLYSNGELQDSITLGFNIGAPAMYFIPGFPLEALLVGLAITLTTLILVRRRRAHQFL
jgi:hypothetical protein